jgi:plastocyanin
MTTSHTARHTRRQLAAAALLITALAGCARDEPVTPPDGEDAVLAEFEIVMDDGLDFEPEVLTVPVGSVVEVVNTSSRAHSVTADDAAPAAFDTGPVPEGDTAQLRLDEPGRYPYHCRFHPDVMDGVLIVEER